ncbi:hypothetical protein PFISCL1PPCAC_5295, partial [Pristionchus fissidentatus]
VVDTLISPEFRMADSSMALIPLLALVPLVISLVLCGKKKELVKEPKKRERPPPVFCPCGLEQTDATHVCQNESLEYKWAIIHDEKRREEDENKKNEQTKKKEEPEKKKEDSVDNPMPEADALELVEAIEKGLVRPQKDDESIDDHKTDWGKTQMTGKMGQTGPGTGTEGLKWKKKD